MSNSYWLVLHIISIPQPFPFSSTYLCLAASEKDERDAWDQVVSAAFLPERDGTLLQRYLSLFRDLPADKVPPTQYEEDMVLQVKLDEALGMLDRLPLTFKEGPCGVCHESSSVRCSRCKKVFYCDTIHQKQGSPILLTMV